MSLIESEGESKYIIMLMQLGMYSAYLHQALRFILDYQAMNWQGQLLTFYLTIQLPFSSNIAATLEGKSLKKTQIRSDTASS